LLDQRITQAVVDEQIEVTITHHVLADPPDAVKSGMTGSPTLLIDGHDPFAEPSLVPSVSCRRYPAEDGGGFEGAPSVAALRAVLRSHRAEIPTEPLSPQDTCCTSSADKGSVVAALGARRGAARPASPIERAAHQAILRAFATTAGPPSADDLDQLAATPEIPIRQVLNNLHELDVIRLDDFGRISSVYPFSATPTPHRVQIVDGAQVYAMCAIDALGISAMLAGRATVITSIDPHTVEPITVTVDGEHVVADPDSTVVFIGAQSAQGPSADTCCNYLNFFTDRQSAQTWATANPHVEGTLLDLAAATQCGAAIFAPLLVETFSPNSNRK
jgi:Alkylmercury lyase